MTQQQMPEGLREAIDREAEMSTLDANEAARPGGELAFLVEELMAAAANVDALKEMLKEAQAKWDELRKKRIPEKMQELAMIGPTGKGNFTHQSGARVYLKVDTYASVRKTGDDGRPTDAFERELWQWLRDNGFGDIIKETINVQTLKSFCKERLDDGEPLPPGVNVHQETVAVLNRPKEG